MTNKAMWTMLGMTLALGGIHCAAPTANDNGNAADEGAAASATGATDGIELAVGQSAGMLVEHCWAQIERPIPADPVLKVGTQLTLKTGGAICPQGLNEKLAYRYYMEKVDKNGNILSPRVSPQGPTEWSLTKSAFSTTNLAPGRYRIYGFSLPRTMIAAWQANDLVARNTSRRTGNAYVDLVETSWSAGDFGECSASCGDGLLSRTVACKDTFGVTRADSFCTDTKPESMQSCNLVACFGVGSDAAQLGGFEDFGLVNTSTATSMMIQTNLGMMCPMPGMPLFMPMMPCPPTYTTISSYDASGYWQDPETVARLDVKVTFLTRPLVPGEYTATSATPGATEARVTVTRNMPGIGIVTWASSSASAKVKVVLGGDDKLHAQIDDAALGAGSSTMAVKADITIAAPPP